MFRSKLGKNIDELCHLWLILLVAHTFDVFYSKIHLTCARACFRLPKTYLWDWAFLHLMTRGSYWRQVHFFDPWSVDLFVIHHDQLIKTYEVQKLLSRISMFFCLHCASRWGMRLLTHSEVLRLKKKWKKGKSQPIEKMWSITSMYHTIIWVWRMFDRLLLGRLRADRDQTWWEGQGRVPKWA